MMSCQNISLFGRTLLNHPSPVERPHTVNMLFLTRPLCWWQWYVGQFLVLAH